MGLKNAICRVSRSTCRLLSGCLAGLHVRFYHRRKTRRVMRSVRLHVSRLFASHLGRNGRIVAVRSIRRVVTQVNGPRSLSSRRDKRTSNSRGRGKAAVHHLFHSPSGGVLNKITSKLTTCVK